MESVKKVVIFTTGGTIASKFVQEEQGSKPAINGEGILATIPDVHNICKIELQEHSNVASSSFTPEHMLQLSKAIQARLDEEDVAGVVVTYGTGTIEEIAYFLDLTIASEKPVVLTGSMRTASAISADGPKNMLCAVKVAVAEEARNLGVLLVMNEEIHAAREVTKTHASNLATFVSPWWGPLGYVDEHMLVIRRIPNKRQHISPQKLGGEVYLLKQVASDSTLIFDYLIEKKVAGIVLEAFGRGNMHTAFQRCVEEAIAAKIPVIITTRCGSGYALPLYSYPGAAIQTEKAGAILSDELNGPKIRIKLMLALGITSDLVQLRQFFKSDCI